jgi:hypothetical protein
LSISFCLKILEKHGVAVAEKPVLPLHRVGVGGANALHAREGRHQHHQRGFGKVKIGDQRIDNLKLKTRRDENVGVAADRF